MNSATRAAVIMGTGFFLLAADRAPETDIASLFPLPASMESADDAAVPAPAIIEEPIDMPAPDLAPVLPEAATLAGMVADVRALDGIARDQELHCLASAIYFEAKGEPLEGQLAVAEVILNRVERGGFGQSICAVVKAPGQFSFVRGGTMPTPVHRASWDTAQAIAVIASADAWSDIVGGATHFHAKRVKPGWRMQRVAQVGNHIFYR